MDKGKPIRLSRHAVEQSARRGANEEEIRQAIQSCPWGNAELGRLQCKKDYPFNQEWNGKPYRSKQVKPIFLEESSEIIVVTAYVYYF